MVKRGSSPHLVDTTQEMTQQLSECDRCRVVNILGGPSSPRARRTAQADLPGKNPAPECQRAHNPDRWTRRRLRAARDVLGSAQSPPDACAADVAGCFASGLGIAAQLGSLRGMRSCPTSGNRTTPNAPPAADRCCWGETECPCVRERGTALTTASSRSAPRPPLERAR
jgi:hypothetical protein